MVKACLPILLINEAFFLASDSLVKPAARRKSLNFAYQFFHLAHRSPENDIVEEDMSRFWLEEAD